MFADVYEPLPATTAPFLIPTVPTRFPAEQSAPRYSAKLIVPVALAVAPASVATSNRSFPLTGSSVTVLPASVVRLGVFGLTVLVNVKSGASPASRRPAHVLGTVGVNVLSAAPVYPAGTFVSLTVYCLLRRRLSRQKTPVAPSTIFVEVAVVEPVVCPGLTVNSAPASAAPAWSTFFTRIEPQLLTLTFSGLM